MTNFCAPYFFFLCRATALHSFRFFLASQCWKKRKCTIRHDTTSDKGYITKAKNKWCVYWIWHKCTHYTAHVHGFSFGLAFSQWTDRCRSKADWTDSSCLFRQDSFVRLLAQVVRVCLFMFFFFVCSTYAISGNRVECLVYMAYYRLFLDGFFSFFTGIIFFCNLLFIFTSFN